MVRVPPQAAAVNAQDQSGAAVGAAGRRHPPGVVRSRARSVRAAAERATEARKEADRLACEAWNKRMLGFQGPAQPSPTLGDALNAGFGYLEVKCLGCNTHQTLPSTSCGDRRQRRSMNWNATCAADSVREVRGYPYKRSHLVALRARRSRRAIRPRRGGRASGEPGRMSMRSLKELIPLLGLWRKKPNNWRAITSRRPDLSLSSAS